MFGLEMTNVWMVLGFTFAAYSVVANDSIQTLGTFIESNKKTRWFILWGFAASILIFTLTLSYIVNSGDISSGRLEKIPFQNVQWYHAMAPLTLVILTRIGIPVSTSLLVLSAFASSLVFESILLKSSLGYAIAAVAAYVIWIVIFRWDNKFKPVSKKNEFRWRVAQWMATGFLWYSWLSHDIANSAVFLPRNLSVVQLILILSLFVGFLGYILYKRGGKIQHIVMEKSHTNYIRSATLIDLTYAIILYIFKEANSIPMSTTWVFIGLLSGRELAMASRIAHYKLKNVFPIVGKDLFRLLFGLAVSIIVALTIQKL